MIESSVCADTAVTEARHASTAAVTFREVCARNATERLNTRYSPIVTKTNPTAASETPTRAASRSRIILVEGFRLCQCAEFCTVLAREQQQKMILAGKVVAHRWNDLCRKGEQPPLSGGSLFLWQDQSIKSDERIITAVQAETIQYQVSIGP